MADQEANDSAFALAITVLRQRIAQLPPDDQHDLCELLPALLGTDAEEWDSAQKAVAEILAPPSGQVMSMALTVDPAASLAKRLRFVSGRIREARQAAKLTPGDWHPAKSDQHNARIKKGGYC